MRPWYEKEQNQDYHSLFEYDCHARQSISPAPGACTKIFIAIIIAAS